MAKDKARSRRGNGRVCREVIRNEISHVIRIARAQVNDEILNSTQEEQLHHFRQGSKLVAELCNPLPRTRANRYAHQHLQVEAHRTRVDVGSEPRNDASRDQAAHPSDTRRCRDPHTLGKLCVCDATIELQLVDNLHINSVKLNLKAQILRTFRHTSPQGRCIISLM